MPSIPPRVGKAASAYRVSRSAAPRGNRLICIERPRLFDGLSLSECTEVVSCAQLKCLRPKENISGHDYAVHPISLLLRGRRSEEQTSELQSRGHLVCPLLLEIKKFSVTITSI